MTRSPGGPGSALLFDIPIYRKSLEEQLAEEEALAQGHIAAMVNYRPESEARILAFQTIRSKPWAFNEVVAWVSVVGLTDMVKTYLSSRGGKYYRRPSGPFGEPDKLTELYIYPEHTNEVLAAEVRDAIVEALGEMPRLARRYVDFESYDRVAPNLDWRRALANS